MRTHKLDGLSEPIPTVALGRVFARCIRCDSQLTTTVNARGLKIACESEEHSFVVAESGRIQYANSDATRFSAHAFQGTPAGRVEVEREPVMTEKLRELAERFEARRAA